ncbi:helix-turn-helix domain-containing protein [Streptomyces chumphonensis]|uniref:helix-turn-helix domain-containing protein n=1 Tax=Streptomyces chumphonensis TaxID=1214925 RepID=UPI003D754DA8
MYTVDTDAIRKAAAEQGDTTAYAIALRIGMAQSSVSRMFRGEMRPSLDTLMKYATAYDKPVEEFVKTGARAAA